MLVPRPLMAQNETDLRHNTVCVGGVLHLLSSPADFVLDDIESSKSIDEWSQSAWQGPCVLVVIRRPVACIERLLVRQLSNWLNTDDVLSSEFVKRVVVVLTRDFQLLEKEPIPTDVRIVQNSWFQDNGCKSVILQRSTKELFDLASGPYFRNDNELHRVSRLYEDFNGAFFSAITKNEELVFEEQRPTIHIAVPSRTYSAHSSLPLAGLRFGIKDLFAIEGLRTSAGSKSYYDFYPPCSRTAKAINMLLSSGAVLVGKTKNTQFANGEDPQEWIDYSCPWNPRGAISKTSFFWALLLTSIWKVMAIKIRILVVAEAHQLCLRIDGSILLWVLIVSVFCTINLPNYSRCQFGSLWQHFLSSCSPGALFHQIFLWTRASRWCSNGQQVFISIFDQESHNF